MLDPTVNGRHQLHRPELTHDQSEQIALVFMRVPNGNPMFPADSSQSVHNFPVARTMIRHRYYRRLPRLCALDELCESRIARGVQISASTEVSTFSQESRAVQNRLIRAAAGPCDEPHMKNYGLSHCLEPRAATLTRHLNLISQHRLDVPKKSTILRTQHYLALYSMASEPYELNSLLTQDTRQTLDRHFLAGPFGVVKNNHKRA
jgi:hypothetical protein